jgi:hypothetical protein
MRDAEMTRKDHEHIVCLEAELAARKRHDAEKVEPYIVCLEAAVEQARLEIQQLGMAWHNALPDERPTLMAGMNQVAVILRALNLGGGRGAVSEPSNKPTVTGTMHGITCSECAQLKARLASAEQTILRTTLHGVKVKVLLDD